MKAMCKILSYSPAWRDIHLKSSILGKSPQQFCGTRWVGSEDTAEKVILVWPDIVALIKHFLALCPSGGMLEKEMQLFFLSEISIYLL